jgi:hypothetical protein
MGNRIVTMEWIPRSNAREGWTHVLLQHDSHVDQHDWWELKTVEVVVPKYIMS